jgi:hypothetical protein
LRNARAYIPRHKDVPDRLKEIHIRLIIIHPSLVSTKSSIQTTAIENYKKFKSKSFAFRALNVFATPPAFHYRVSNLLNARSITKGLLQGHTHSLLNHTSLTRCVTTKPARPKMFHLRRLLHIYEFLQDHIDDISLLSGWSCGGLETGYGFAEIALAMDLCSEWNRKKERQLCLCLCPAGILLITTDPTPSQKSSVGPGWTETEPRLNILQIA